MQGVTNLLNEFSACIWVLKASNKALLICIQFTYVRSSRIFLNVVCQQANYARNNNCYLMAIHILFTV